MRTLIMVTFSYALGLQTGQTMVKAAEDPVKALKPANAASPLKSKFLTGEIAPGLGANMAMAFHANRHRPVSSPWQAPSLAPQRSALHTSWNTAFPLYKDWAKKYPRSAKSNYFGGTPPPGARVIHGGPRGSVSKFIDLLEGSWEGGDRDRILRAAGFDPSMEFDKIRELGLLLKNLPGGPKGVLGPAPMVPKPPKIPFSHLWPHRFGGTTMYGLPSEDDSGEGAGGIGGQ